MFINIKEIYLNLKYVGFSCGFFRCSLDHDHLVIVNSAGPSYAFRCSFRCRF